MNFKESIKTWGWQVLTVMFLLLFLSKGCTNKKLTKINKNLTESNTEIVGQVDSLAVVISNLEGTTMTSKQANDIMERVMLDYLIYEDDLDKGKTSISEIKNKIEMND